MRFERIDKLLVDPIEAGALEIALSDTFGGSIEVEDKGSYFEVDIKKYGLDERMVVSFLEQDRYRIVR